MNAADKRLMMLGTLSTMAVERHTEGDIVRVSCKGISYEAKGKPNEVTADVYTRALLGLLVRVDNAAELVATKLGPKPAPQKPRGIAAARATQATAITGPTVPGAPPSEIEATPDWTEVPDAPGPAWDASDVEI